MKTWGLAWFLLCAGLGFAQVALVVNPAGGEWRRGKTPMRPLRAGDLLKVGDRIEGFQSGLEIWWCSGGKAQAGSFTVQERRARLTVDLSYEKSEAFYASSKTGPSVSLGECLLPQPRIIDTHTDLRDDPNLGKLPASGPPMASIRREIAKQPARLATLSELERWPAQPMWVRDIILTGLLLKWGLRDLAVQSMTNLLGTAPVAQRGWLRDAYVEAMRGGDVGSSHGATLYALLVGVNQFGYRQLPPLCHAEHDADLFDRVLKNSLDAMEVDRGDIVALKAATMADIEPALKQLEDAKANDTIVILFSTHGTVTADGDVLIYLNGSNPASPTTALSFTKVIDALKRPYENQARILILLDVCRTRDAYGIVPSGTPNRSIRSKWEKNIENATVLLASQEKEAAHEGIDPASTNGLFSYFVALWLTGGPAGGRVEQVTNRRLFTEVNKAVSDVYEHQHPDAMMKQDLTLVQNAFKGKSLSELEDPSEVQCPSPDKGIVFEAYDPPSSDAAADADVQRAEGNSPLNPSERNDLAKRLISKGHRELLRYLEGDRVPQTKDRFTSGQRYYSAAARLWPLDTTIQARELFFRARVATFDHNYKEAREWLNQALEFNEAAEYVHNALGIAILEDTQAPDRLNAAAAQFRRAIELAPYWIYPRHNLALVEAERGRTGESERQRRALIAMDPNNPYLHYSLGVQLMQREKWGESRRELNESLRLAKQIPDPAVRRDRALPLNALGLIQAHRGHYTEALNRYAEAVLVLPGYQEAIHNSGLALKALKRVAEARQAWIGNHDYLPSLIALAENSEPRDAIGYYSEILSDLPALVSASLDLARLYAQLNRLDEAVAVLSNGLQHCRYDSERVHLLEERGELWRRLGQPERARADWSEAASLLPDGKLKKAIQARMRIL